MKDLLWLSGLEIQFIVVGVCGGAGIRGSGCHGESPWWNRGQRLRPSHGSPEIGQCRAAHVGQNTECMPELGALIFPLLCHLNSLSMGHDTQTQGGVPILI